MWYTITPNICHPDGTRWRKRVKVDDVRVALYAQTFPPFWVLPPAKTVAFRWVGEAMPPLYARHLLLQHGAEGSMLDLFSGIGGWSLGFVLTGRCKYVEMVEKDKRKCQYLKANFRFLRKAVENHIPGFDFNVVCADVMRYEPADSFDVVVGSPPCEDFSVLRALSGQYGVERKGTLPLTSRYVDIVAEARPKLALYENVYARILAKHLEARGFTVEKHDMSTIIPQRRVRLIASWRNKTHKR